MPRLLLALAAFVAFAFLLTPLALLLAPLTFTLPLATVPRLLLALVAFVAFAFAFLLILLALLWGPLAFSLTFVICAL